MKKYIIYFLVFISFIPLLLIFFNTLADFLNLEKYEKKTLEVNSCYVKKWGRENLNIYFKNKAKLFECKDEGDIRVVVTMVSLRELPKVKKEDTIVYYELKKEYLDKTNISKIIPAVGVSTQLEQRGSFQVFLDILSVYMNSVYYIGFLITSVLFLYLDKLLSSKIGNKLLTLSFSIYVLLFILV